MIARLFVLLALAIALVPAAAASARAESFERMAELTFVSAKTYADPFNDVDVDVIFTSGERTWRVPAFWHGGQRWTVRFAPPQAGTFRYRLATTDRANPTLGAPSGEVEIRAYAGGNDLLRHGMIKVSANGRNFEQADGTPFYWLGDTWWSGLSDRLSWDGFQRLTADRKTKGFTVVQLTGGLVPTEEVAPLDAGFYNEGGAVWTTDFTRINPVYFDFADRRIAHLVENGLAPAIVGAWSDTLPKMGVARMKQHWRYLIARYAAYPVFWIVAGETLDPPEEQAEAIAKAGWTVAPGWTEVLRYVRETDPYHHPVSTHEAPPPVDYPVGDETLLDFDMLQPSHFGWSSVANAVALLNRHYARTSVVRPIVQSEIGYEGLGETNWQDFQRMAFWLSMLNGAAGHTYGAVGTWESYEAEKPLHRMRWSFTTWEEGMHLPGSYQVGLGAKLLRQYPWWRFDPHPDWLAPPRGSTLLEATDQSNGFDLGTWDPYRAPKPDGQSDEVARLSFRAPYAAGIPGLVRFIYVPYSGSFGPPMPPTIIGLEEGLRYHAYLWQPALGIRFDLGAIERPQRGKPLVSGVGEADAGTAWRLIEGAWQRDTRSLTVVGVGLALLDNKAPGDAIIETSVAGGEDAELLLRYLDADNFTAARYEAGAGRLSIIERRAGKDSVPLGSVALPPLTGRVRLAFELRGDRAAASVSIGKRSFSTPIVTTSHGSEGRAGFTHRSAGTQEFGDFALYASPALVEDAALDRQLVDAAGRSRGVLEGLPHPATGRGWSGFGRRKDILLDAWRPEAMPGGGDWLIVLERSDNSRD